MKTVVIPNDISVPGIVNDELYRTYTQLLEKDIAELLGASSAMKAVHCPGCLSAKATSFAKIMGMEYKVCEECGSYFVAQRPSQASLNHFYAQSTACRYWRQEMSKLVDQKLYYIYGPRVAWILEWADEYFDENLVLVDYQTKYSFLIKHLTSQNIFAQIKLLEPQLYENEQVLPAAYYIKNVEEAAHLKSVDMFTSFESLERVSDPDDLIKKAYAYCKPGGLFLLTTATSSGFEYQVLKEHAPNLNPINRMNLLSLEAIVVLLEKNNFEILELSTPGRLDVEIVKNVIESKDIPEVDHFWKYVFGKRKTNTLSSLQEFLQTNRLSSHVRIVAKKKN